MKRGRKLYHSIEEYREAHPNESEESYKRVEEMIKIFGPPMMTITIPMLYTKEVNAFVRKIEWAHKLAAKSRLVFKGGLEKATA